MAGRPIMTLLGPVAAVALALALAGCERVMYDAGQATRPYPEHLHTAKSVSVQVFRKGPTLEIVNSLPRSFEHCDVWLNQRFVYRVGTIEPGATVRVSLWNFWDVRGDRFSGGGFWRTERPTLLRLVELQLGEQEPLIGLVTIPEG